MKSWAIVTGASSGIGAEFARRLSERHAVLAVARRRERLEELRAWAASRGGEVEVLVADLQTVEGVAAVAARARQLEVEVLVNCAGYADHGAFIDLPADAARKVVDLNVTALLELTHAVLPGLIARRRGAVVNVASGMAFQAVPYFSVYAATKAMVLAFTDGLAQELTGTGVQVQALCPGVTRTEFGSVAGVEETLAKFPTSDSEQVVRASLRGLQRRQVVVTVGWFTRLMGALARITPRGLNRRIGGRLMRPAMRALPAVAQPPMSS